MPCKLCISPVELIERRGLQAYIKSSGVKSLSYAAEQPTSITGGDTVEQLEVGSPSFLIHPPCPEIEKNRKE